MAHTNPDGVIPSGLSPEERRIAHQHYVVNYSNWKKRSLTKIGLAKWKHSRNKLPWCQEGLQVTALTTLTCIPVSLLVLGLVETPEDAIQGLNQSADIVAIKDNNRITEGSDYATVWCPRAVHRTMGSLGWSCRKIRSKLITNVGMYLIEGTQNNRFSDGVNKWTFDSHIESPIRNPQPWRHAVGVIDGFFFHFDNEDKNLNRYPISLLVGKEGQSPQQNFNYFIRILKVFSIKPKGQYEWNQRSLHRRKLKLDVGCFCVGKVQCKKLKWEKTCDNLCPCMDCGGCWV